MTERLAQTSVRDTSTDGVNVADLLKLEPEEVTVAKAVEARRRQKELLDAQIIRDGRLKTPPRARQGAFGTLERGAVTVRMEWL